MVNDFVVLKSAGNPSSTTVFTLPYIFTVDSSLDLNFKVTSGTATDVTMKVLYAKVCQ